MRGTLHLVPAADLPLYHRAFQGAWRTSLGRFLERQGLPPREVRLTKVYPLVLDILRGGPLPRQEIEARLQPLLPEELRGRVGFTGWGGSLKEMAYEGLIVHAPSRGAEAPLASVAQWLPGVGLGAMDEMEAVRELARRYFAAYGPATPRDLATWSGIPASTLRPALQALRGELVEVDVLGHRRRYLTPRADLRLLARIEGAPAPPRFLPRFDVLLLAHRDRSRLIEATFLRRVVLPAGRMEAPFLVDGRVAGTWGMARQKRELILSLQPFRPLARASVSALREEAQLLAEFYGAEASVVKVP
jgi:hypothetical protein